MMRVRSAEDMIAEFRKEMEEMLAEMDELASRIDEQFGEVLGRHKELRRKLLR
jgi:alkylhydroperoxidase/carboxymuconolactone decarboxylase family protein YurZ